MAKQMDFINEFAGAPPPDEPPVEKPDAKGGTVPPEAQKPEPEPAKPEAEEEKAPLESEKEGEKKPSYVPLAALHEERERRRELQAEVAANRDKISQMEAAFTEWQRRQTEQQKPEGGIPTYDEDPLGHLSAINAEMKARLDTLEGRTNAKDQEAKSQATEQQLLNKYAASVREFSRTQTDFQQAYSWLANALDEDLKARGYDDPTERGRAIQYEEGLMVGRALYQNKNPAELIYAYAQARGYKPKGANTAGDENKLERLEKGAKAAQSLSGPKGSGENVITLERLAELAQSDPDEFDRQWNKAQKKGLLG